MSNVKIEWNMPAFVEISNIANQKVCLPIAQQVAAQVYDATIETTPRSSVDGWARTKVVRPNMFRERNSGRLARALGSAGM